MTRVLCLGDSITDCGRLCSSPPLGNGYVKMLDQYQKENNLNWSITNKGFDGFTVHRLIHSIESYIPGLSVNIITILIGINDVALMMNTCTDDRGREKMTERFLAGYEKLLEMLKGHADHILLMEPFLFPKPLEYLTWIPRLLKISRGIALTADRHGSAYLPLHEELNQYAQKYGADAITTDGVHLTEYGHKLLVRKLFPVLLDFAACEKNRREEEA